MIKIDIKRDGDTIMLMHGEINFAWVFPEKNHIIFDQYANTASIFGLAEEIDYPREVFDQGLTVEKIRSLAEQ